MAKVELEHSREIEELKEELLDRDQKLQRLKHKRQRLRKQNDRLEKQLANIASSRAWKLVDTLRHIKDRLKWRSWS
jgi:FtsZ-binding cell division protein ZapB